MLAGQMVAVQSITMDLLHEIGASGNRLQLNDAGTLAVKLLRTYVAQLEALKRYRSAGEQVPPLDTNITRIRGFRATKGLCLKSFLR
jgi:hypothetical protein